MKSGFSVIVLFIVLALTGCLLLPMLPVKLFPSRNLPSLTVNFSMPYNSSRIVEQEVTSRLEGALSRVNGIKNMESRSGNGYGSIRLELDKHTDVDMARLEVSSVVRQLWGSFPEGVSYPTVSARQAKEEAKAPFMTYTVTSPMNSMDISAYVDEKVKPVLADIPGVAEVSVFGVTPNEWRLEYDADKIMSLGLSPNDIISAISRYYGSEFLGMALTEDGWIRLVRQASGRPDEFDISKMQVVTKNGLPINLDRIVTACHTEGSPVSYFRINGLTSIYLNITAEEDANQLEVGNKVQEAIGDISLHAPDDMRFLLSNDATDTIREELTKIYFRTGLTVLILLLFIMLVTRNMRYTLLIVISLAINLAVAVILYWMFDTEIQLYSLAGITISLNLVIDNTIVMCDHYMRRHDRKAFSAILAATLTTAGALVVVFFMDDEVRLNLEDFVIVVVINLIVSLLVALLLVPALADRFKIRIKNKRGGKISRTVSLFLNRVYGKYICFALRWRWAFFIIMLGAMGWTGYLFFSKVREGVYFNRDQGERMLYVNASLPNGSTLQQMDALIRKMETYLAAYDGIRQFQTNIYNGRQGSITIRFTKEAAAGGFPYRLKSDIVSKALTLGGGSWSVYGLEDNGFNNDVRESAGNMRVKLLGFNYDELNQYAGILRDTLLSHRRIKEVEMKSDFSYWKDDYTEFSLTADREALAKEGLTINEFYTALAPVFGRDMESVYIQAGGYMEPVKLSSLQSRSYDVWGLLNMPVTVNGKSFKLSELAQFNKGNVPQDIVKENQSYRLCMQYDYIGSYEQGKKMLDRTLEKFSGILPAGYSVSKDENTWSWGEKDFSRYWLLAIVALIIFFLSAILFNSLMMPFAIIAIIPMSYVGIFLTFWLFDLKFDQGGFASFILLSGITVNAAIYIINEFDNIRSHFAVSHVAASGATGSTRLNRRLYMQAFRVKIMPVIMTVISTVLGFIPFLVGTSKESFWYPLAAGTIGGLVFSIVAIVGYLPMLVLKPERRNRDERRSKIRLRLRKRK
ncbi:MAG: efflux RND transporter permease subunit [Muribaculaceae bacterium]|nr:efflux RND transporter permease subunit [Muribaculaceae bacterium]